MAPNLIPNILAISFIVVPVFISIRAFFLYARTRSRRLFILGWALAYIALTALDNLVVNLLPTTFNTYWFLYFGQTASFFFLFLSLLSSFDAYLRRLMIWQIIVSVLLLGLLLSSPLLPPFPNLTIRAIVNVSRSIPCFGVGLCYTHAFMKKSTRFSFLMGLAFFLIAYGITITVTKYFNPSTGELLDTMGDITRLVGLATLLSAVFSG